MKTKFLLIFLILLLGCVSSKIDTFNTVQKEYAGSVISITYLNSYTLIETEINPILIEKKVKLDVGTKCYFYFIKNDKTGSEKVMVIWKGAGKGYQLN